MPREVFFIVRLILVVFSFWMVITILQNLDCIKIEIVGMPMLSGLIACSIWAYFVPVLGSSVGIAFLFITDQSQQQN